ncbi:MAG TPA: 30S ribosomal protein S12 methylthiotransferase RimO [bacterium]|nr:30S ribosomal protein S12 methylthiotransferase RimO [bacterium]
MTSVHFISLGCPKNLVDSEVMLGLLIEAGFSLTEDASSAEVIVVNTCAFIEDAKREAIDALLEMGEMKRAGRCRLLVAAGCLPQRYREELAKLLPEVDAFIGAGDFPRIVEILGDRLKSPDVKTEERSVCVGAPEYLYDHMSPRLQITPAHAAYVKIAEGCFHPCSFCIIPKLRGRFRSRRPESVVEEVRGLLGRGVREINLVAQDSTAYGRDVGSDIATLMEELARLPGPKWLRLLYSYPHGFPDRLIEVIRDSRDVCKYVDVPIQHISDRVLRSMKRKGAGAEIRELVGKLRREIPGVSLRTSLIVGYPGETQEDFDMLLDFVCEARFEHLGVFTYSPEEGTAASRLKGRVTHEVAARRRDEIMDVQRDISLENNRRYLGRRLRVLVEGVSPESDLLIAGRHEGQAPEIDGVVYINDGSAARGEFAEVEITEAHEYDLVGRTIAP